ncbi:MAG: hypothetical protein ACE5GJ_01430 [Gemmatimonadota bacterium]
MRSLKTLGPLALTIGLLGACDLPTEAPMLEQRWVVSVDDATIGVDELLPTGVSASGNAFSVSVDPVTTSEVLGTLCSSCAALNGLTTNKPAFDGTFSTTASLPGEVSSAELSSGSIDVTIRNNFSFDPIQPGGGSTGTVTITISDQSSGMVLGQTVLDGATDALPAGASVTRVVSLTSATVGSTLMAAVEVDSPAGAMVTINTSESIQVTATPSSILVSSATVDVSGQDVTIDPVDLDVGDIDSTITDHIQNGAIILEITNPFGVGISGTLDINYPGGTISKSLTIPAQPTSTATLSYSGEELRSFLGQTGVVLTGNASVTGGGLITVTPGEVATLGSKIDLTLQIGG